MSLQRLLEIKEKLPLIYQERLISELEVIINNGIKDFMPYFIALKDSIDWCKQNNVLVGPARGSAGGTLIGFLLGLHSLDPIKYKLPFKRFLSVSRLKKSVPDLDIDFPTGARDRLNNFLFNKYGDNCAFVATFSMLKLKNSLMDSFRIKVIQPTEYQITELIKQNKISDAKVLEFSLENQKREFNEIRKAIEKCPIGFTDQEWLLGAHKDGTYYPGVLETDEIFREWTERYPKVLETVKEIMGIPRAIGQHAAGVVIADIPIYELCPVFKVDGKSVIAYDKKTIAKHGLIKNDNLGLTCLNFIGDCLKLIKEKGIILDPWNLPENEPDVYATFMDGTARTIFQHDSIGGASLVKKLKPNCLDHIAYSVALNRPGALDATVKIGDREVSGADAFMLRKAGKAKVEYIHPDLEPLLKETYGIMVFQENTMEVLQAFAGYSEEESDNIRGAISDKNPNAFTEVKQRLQNLLTRGWTQTQIDQLFQQVVAWGAYGFNKSHAYGYAKIAYCTAYLKTKFPLEWWCSVLSNATPDEIMEKFWPEIGKMIAEPDINLSKEKFIIQGDKLIPPLKLIANLGPTVLHEITTKAPFADFIDFKERVDSRIVNKRIVLNLIKAGCMDKFFTDYPTLYDKIKWYFSMRDTKKEDVALIEALEDVTPYQEYLLAKEILPICNKKLSEAVQKSINLKKPFLSLTKYTKDGKYYDYESLRGDYTLLTGNDLIAVADTIEETPDSYFDACVYGYVVVARKFSYKSKKHDNMLKQALELTLDFDCNMVKIMCWPRKHDHAPQIAEHIQEKKAYLFRIRINRDPTWRYSIIGVEDIKEKNNEEKTS